MIDNSHNRDLIRKVWTQRHTADSSWLGNKRQAALDVFEKIGFPDKQQEAWRYADLRSLRAQYPEWLSTSSFSQQANSDAAMRLPESTRIVFSDGRFIASSSDPLPTGVFAGTAADVTAAATDFAEQQWGSLANDDHSGLISINSAFSDSVVVIDVPAGHKLEKPLHLIFLGATPQSVTLPRILIRLGEAAEATVIENYFSAQPRIVNAVTEIQCAARSRLAYYKAQEDAAGSWHTAAQYALLAEGVQLETTHIDLGKAAGRNELTVRLAGEQAHARCNGVFVADQTYVENRINIEHLAPNTTSRERFRGILAGSAKGVFNGRIYVAREAQKTSAELSNRNLLLDSGAEINTKPELEIYADDVRCAHGSTTGQLDAQALFYLLSRGIAPQEARNVLIRAFASELVLELGIDALTDRVQARLADLGGASG